MSAWVLVLILMAPGKFGSTSLAVPMVDKGTCQIAILAAMDHHDSVVTAFCLRSGYQDVKP